jgi:hypothetical protein
VSTKRCVHRWDAKENVVIIRVSITAVLVAFALVIAFAEQALALGWVVVFGFAALASLVGPRERVSARSPADAVDERRRLLVVADAFCSEPVLCDEIQARLDGAVAVHLVVPVRVSHLHFLANDEAEERRDAEQTMVIVVGLLQRRGISATGAVGTDKPLESMTHALAAFPATQVLLALPPEGEWYWFERDLLEKARGLTELAVTQVVVPSALPAACDGLEQVVTGVAHQANERSEETWHP